jgi:hypothetical protein
MISHCCIANTDMDAFAHRMENMEADIAKKDNGKTILV